jgi:hypothetical protein
MSESNENQTLKTVPTTYYRSELPAHLTPFASNKGKLYFKEALNQGYAEGYFGLMGNFTTQSETKCESTANLQYICYFVLIVHY